MTSSVGRNFETSRLRFLKKDRKQLDLGLELRLNQNAYPEITFVGSLHAESKIVNTTERSIGMPSNSTDTEFHKPSSAGQLQISSSSANDTSGGTGARQVVITGLYEDSAGNWLKRSETLTMNGQTAVNTTNTDWIRINFMSVVNNQVGSNDSNVGDIYLSPQGQTLSSGVPTANTICAIISDFSASSMGDFSTATNEAFVFTIGNFFFLNDNNNRITLREQYRFNNTGPTYQVGYYPAGTESYNYFGI